MTISTYAVKINSTYNDLMDILINLGIFNKTELPRKKYIDAGILADNGNIRDILKFEKLLAGKLDII